MAQVQIQVPSSTKKRERSQKSFDSLLVPTPSTLIKSHLRTSEPSPLDSSIISQEFATPPAEPEPSQPVTGSLGGKRSKKHLERPVPRPLVFDHDDDTPGYPKKAGFVQALFPSDDSSSCASPREVEVPKPTPIKATVHIGDGCLSPLTAPATVIRTRPQKLAIEDKSPIRPLILEPSPTEERGSRCYDHLFPLGSFGDRESFTVHNGLDRERHSFDRERQSISISRGPRESTKFENMDFHEYNYHDDIEPLETPHAPPELDCVTPSVQINPFDWDLPTRSHSPSSTTRSPVSTYRNALRSPRLSMTDDFCGSPRSIRFSCSFRPIKDTPGPKHPERQRSGSLLSLVPEFDAFVEKEHLQPLPQTVIKKKKGREPPPTPLPHRLSRQNSLYDDKMLLQNFKALTVESSMGESGRIFATEFRDHRQVGSGAFFDVFRVEQRRKSKKVFAIKRSKRAFRSKRDRSEYLREIEMVSSLPLHNNVITYYRAWQEELHFFIQMEYCHSNLSDFVNGRTLSERFLWDCFQQIAQGLSHVHNGDLIHLDIKPENILVDLKGQRVHPVYKLGDFGQARLSKHWADGSEGDSQYVAPEVIHQGKGGADPTAAADIFSLGLLMFELSSRYALPKNGDLWHDLRLGAASQELPIAMAKIQCSELKSLIMCCLEPNPTARITADAIVEIASAHLQKREGSC